MCVRVCVCVFFFLFFTFVLTLFNWVCLGGLVKSYGCRGVWGVYRTLLNFVFFFISLVAGVPGAASPRFLGPTHRLQSSSFLWFIFRIL